MATVLIIASDTIIGGLLGHLTDLAGHAAQFRREGEELGKAVSSSHPDIVMVDASYGVTSLDAVAGAAAEAGAPIVYFSSTLPAVELRRLALARKAKYFLLPAGPRLLGRVLGDALRPDRIPDDSTSLSRYAVTSAVAAVTRARVLVARTAALASQSDALRSEQDAVLADCRRSHAELREAVIAYTRELRSAGSPPDRALALVKDALKAEVVPDRASIDVARDLDDAVEWCLQAYYAA